MAERIACGPGLGGVCLFGPNIVSFPQLRALTDAIYAENPRALIAIDEEGGDVTRLFHDVGSPFPGNAVLGRIDDLGATRNAAAQIGWELRRAGCNVNFAPTVDINSNPDNPVIGTRSFGVDAERVAAHSAAWTDRAASRPASPRPPSTSPVTATPRRIRTCPCPSSTAPSRSCDSVSSCRSRRRSMRVPGW